MSGDLTPTLPGTPGPRLEALWETLSPAQRDALYPHLVGTTSADWIATTLWQIQGRRISASSIRTYRRVLAQTGV